MIYKGTVVRVVVRYGWGVKGTVRVATMIYGRKVLK
jgi:hypothetical protein